MPSKQTKSAQVETGLTELVAICPVMLLPYSGILSREKTFVNFVVLWLFAKVFSAKFGGVASFCAAICEGFLPQKFLVIRYDL